MKLKPKVDKSYYRKLPQSQFSDFLQDVVKSTDGNQRYAKLADVITIMKEKANVFTEALIACQQGGKDRVLAKNIAMQEALHATNNFANGLNFFSKGDINFFTGSNMPLQHLPEKHTGELLPPYKLAAQPTGVSGQVILTFEIPAAQKNSVTNVGVEWSIDEGQTWQNGKYPSKKSRMVLDGLPSLQKVMIRLRCLGTRSRVSNWSDPITVPVV